MDEDDRLAGRFEANRPRLRAMAYRMFGSLSDADDALQEAWIHAAGAATVPAGAPATLRGAAAVARGARAASARSQYSRVALVNGTPGIVMAPRGRLRVVLAFTMTDDKISRIDVIADPARLETLDLAVLDD